MNIRNIIAALALLGLTGAGANAQNRYVSQDAATVLGSDKYYISMAGEQSGGGMTVDFVMEAAVKGSSAMTRMSMDGFQDVTLYSGGTAWTLDEKEKTWSSEGGSSGALNFGKLTFKKQYSCKVDGKPFYYDEYSSSTGMSVNLFYDSGKVSAIEISSMGQVVVAMWLHSCSARIPSSMYFTLTPSWRASDGSKTPPTASEAWKDTAASNELACGTRTDALVVTDRKPLGTPVYASNFGAVQSAPAVNWRTTADYSIEGILVARDVIAAAAEAMTKDELLDAMLAASENDASAIFAGQVTGDLIEYAVARAALIPMPFFINGACALIMEAGKPEVAEKMLEAVYESNPENVAVACNLAECYIETGKIAQARKVLPKVIGIAPAIGQLYQLYATTCLAEGDAFGTMDNLCLALSKGYCSDITATQLEYMLQVITAPIAHLKNDGDEYDRTFNRLFSDKNLELLKQAVKFGLEEPSSTPAIQDMSWTFGGDDIAYTYPALERHSNEVMKLCNDIADRMPGNFPCFIMCMPDGKYGENLASLKAAGMGIDSYEASNCWALFMLQTYYSLKCSKARGEFAYQTESGGYEGWYNPFYGPSQQRCSEALTIHDPQRESLNWEFGDANAAFMKKSPTSEEIQIFQSKWKVRMIEAEVGWVTDERSALLKERRNYYDSCILPILQEFWKTTGELAPYLQDELSQRFFIGNAKTYCLREYNQIFSYGISAGKEVRAVHDALAGARAEYDRMLGAQAERERAAMEEHRAQVQALLDDGEYFANSDGGLGRDVNFALTFKSPLIPYEGKVGVKNGHLFYEKTDIKTGVTTGRIPSLEQNYTREVVTSEIMTLAEEQEARVQQFKKERAQYFMDMLTGEIPIVKDVMEARGHFTPSSTTVVREVYKTQDSAGNIIRQGTRTTSTTNVGGQGFISTTTEASRHTGSYTTVMRKSTHVGKTGGLSLGFRTRAN